MDHPFEIHALRAGKWKIDSIMDDKELAVEAAKALARRNGIEAVRVVREMFNQQKGEFARRTVFHTSRQQETIQAETERKKAAAAEDARDQDAMKRLAQAERKRVEARRKRAARMRIFTMLGASAAAVVAVIGWVVFRT
jgi:multidrug resistance efflux pump